MKKMALLYNPNAGKGRAENHLAEMIRIFSEGGFEVTAVPIQEKGFLEKYIAKEHKRFGVITVAGGDGTVNEAINALIKIEGEKPQMGYIPMGTTNDFAASCMIPSSVPTAARAVVEGGCTDIDAGKFNDRYFSYVAAFGMFTSVAYGTPQSTKNILGRAAYILEGIKQLANVKSYDVSVCVNGKTISDSFIYGMVANSLSVGGVNLKSMDVDLKDGLFEVLLLKKIHRLTDINMIISDLKQNKKESDYYYLFKTDRISFKTEDALPWTIDGEYGGKQKEVSIVNIPRSIKIRVAHK